MPTEIAIVVAAIVFAFLCFAAALYWAESRTRGMHH